MYALLCCSLVNCFPYEGWTLRFPGKSYFQKRLVILEKKSVYVFHGGRAIRTQGHDNPCPAHDAIC